MKSLIKTKGDAIALMAMIAWVVVVGIIFTVGFIITATL